MSSSRHLRLRVVVQRHTLPEERVVFSLPLDNDPTVAKFLEQVNDIIPLESSDWGLEDYAVEIRNAGGRAFECLHFQSVAAILDKDDEVYIRPLDTNDHRKRRLSGRHQISHIGMRLIDGVAFGRPRLRVPHSRPSVDIPPLKRRRLTPAAGTEEEHGELDEGKEAEFTGFSDGPGCPLDHDYGHNNHNQAEETPRLLTQHGEQRSSLRVRFASPFGGEDENDREGGPDDQQDNANFSDQALGDADSSDDDMDQDMDQDHESIQDELRDLLRDIAEHEEPGDERGHVSEEGQDQTHPSETTSLVLHHQKGTATAKNDRGLGLEDLDKLAALRKTFPHVPLPTLERALLQHGRDVTKTYRSLRQRFEPRLSHLGSSPCVPQKTTLHPSAAPAVLNDMAAYEDAAAGESDAESTNSTTRRYDQHGFPTGSILAGTVATTMAESMRKLGKAVKDPVHIRFHDGPAGVSPRPGDQHNRTEDHRSADDSAQEDEDDQDEDSGDEDEDAEEDDADDGDDDDDSGEENEGDNDDFHKFASDSEDASDSDEDSDAEMGAGGGERDAKGSEGQGDGSSHDDGSSEHSEDSGPEQTSSKQNPGGAHLAKFRPNPEHDKSGSSSSESDDSGSTSDSSDDSDDEQDVPRRQTVSPARKRNAVGTRTTTTTGGSGSSSSSSDHDSDSGSSSESHSGSSDDEDDIGDDTEITNFPPSPEKWAVEPLSGRKENVTLQQIEEPSPSVPPGHGLVATRKRNDRRRKAIQRQRTAEEAKQETAAAGSDEGHTKAEQNISTMSAQVAAKKAALLQRLSSIGESSQNEKGERLHEGGASVNAQSTVLSPPTRCEGRTVDTPDADRQELGNESGQVASTSPSQAHPRLNVGAGRRMIFGALGLKTPKSTADEERIRTILMKNVRPLTNARLAEQAGEDGQQPTQDDQAGQAPLRDEEAGSDAWRSKISYRAVECFDEGVDLSEPPFPFVQRWDPQQQGRRGQCGGGGGKRKQSAEADLDYDEADEQPGQADGAKRRRFNHGALREDPDSMMVDREDGYSKINSRDMSDRPGTTATKKEGAKGPKLGDEDEDLPSLPADLTKLRPLQAGNAGLGMIITWKQWLLSSATNWQPCVASMTGSVIEADPGAAMIKIQLAKRDRHRDGYDKTYDEEGNRIYGRFDAPDMDEDTREEETDMDAERGIRSLEFKDLMDPRILKDVNVAGELDVSRGQAQPEDHRSSDHQAEPVGSVIPGTAAEPRNASPEFQTAGTGSAGSLDITEERRHEITLMVKDAGFRQDVTPSLGKVHDQENFLNMQHRVQNSPGSASPSRQLEDLGDSIVLKSIPSPVGAMDVNPTQDVESQHLDMPISSANSASGGRQPDPGFLASPDAPGLDDGQPIDMFASSLPPMYGFSPRTRRSAAAAAEENKTISPRAEEGTRDVSPESDTSDDSLPSLRRLSQSRRKSTSDSSDEAQSTDSEPAPAPAGTIHDLAKKLTERPIEKPATGLRTKPAATSSTRKVRTIKAEPGTAPAIRTATPGLLTTTTTGSSKRNPQQAHSKLYIPPDPHVISLLTSSPEPACVENYADEDVDETYDEMPRGSGWADKKRSGRQGRSRLVRGSRRRS